MIKSYIEVSDSAQEHQKGSKALAYALELKSALLVLEMLDSVR